jgi:class 3 adenylate cyclase
VRVPRTFAFLDLCGFTAYNEARGDDAAIAVLAHLRARLRASAERSGVHVTRWLGDGAMVCGADPGATIECAAAVRDAVGADGPLPLRGGIAAGEVVVFEGDDHVGAAVNLSARLCDQARPGELLIAAPLLDGLHQAPEAEQIVMRLAGISGLVTAHRLPCCTAALQPESASNGRDRVASQLPKRR